MDSFKNSDSKKEILYIDSFEYIKEGKRNEKIITDKEVYISDTIDCRGSLHFINCNIIYGSDDSSGEISMQRESDNASDTFSSPLPAELSDSLEQIWNNLQVGYDESKINS